MKEISLYIMAFFYLAAGINHFIMPRFYLKIMPPYIPWHLPLVYLSGLAEIMLGGLLLNAPLSKMAAWGIIALLVAIFPANIYHLTASKPGKGIPIWILYLRLPLQALLIYWAWWHTY